MFKTKTKYLSLLIFLILFGSILRLYNINFDDFWYDEMVSFWISDPNINLEQSLDRIFSSNLMITYELFLKYFHYIWGYDVYISRYFSSLISILSIFLFYLLLKKNSSKETAIFGVFLLVLNIYHIGYSFEVRTYILTFLLSLILINFIFDNKKIKNSFKILDYFFIFILTTFLLFSHAFSAIIIFSLLIFLIINILQNNADKKKFFSLIIVFLISLVLFLSIYLGNISHYPDWIEQIKPNFITNLYFSKFFGSRILGIIFLTTFIYLVLKFKNEFFKNTDIFMFFLILFLSSYFLPIIFGYLFKPILVDRYIFFVLIPLLSILSHFVLLIKNKITKYILIFLLLAVQIINLFDENTFKQFYKDIYPSKPEIKKILNDINSSDTSIYSIKLKKNNEMNYNKIRKNYLAKYSEKLNFDLLFFNYYENKNFPQKLWLIYFKDVTKEQFKIPSSFYDYSIVASNSYNRAEIYLIQKKINQ